MAEEHNPEPFCNWNELDIRFKSLLGPAQCHDPTIITVDDEQMAQFANNFILIHSNFWLLLADVVSLFFLREIGRAGQRYGASAQCQSTARTSRYPLLPT